VFDFFTGHSVVDLSEAVIDNIRRRNCENYLTSKTYTNTTGLAY